MSKQSNESNILFFSIDESGERVVSRNQPASVEANHERSASVFPLTELCDGGGFGDAVHLQGEPDFDSERKGAVLPRVECGADLVQRAKALGIDPASLMKRYDDALIFVPDLFDRYRRMVDRLDNPLYLQEEKRNEHVRYLTLGRQVACTVFARHDYVQGIDSLVKHGIANATDLAEVIDKLAGNPVTVTAIARLLELNRLNPSSANRDYSL